MLSKFENLKKKSGALGTKIVEKAAERARKKRLKKEIVYMEQDLMFRINHLKAHKGIWGMREKADYIVCMNYLKRKKRTNSELESEIEKYRQILKELKESAMFSKN